MMSGRNEGNKQIGCMNGIFHIFERHHFRRLGRHANKRLLPGASHMEESASEQQNLGKNTKVSKESSKILPLPDQTQTSFHQRDLRDAVKDSMHREARSLSIKTVAKTEGKVRVVKRVDSPRPSQEGLMRGPTKVHEPRRLSYDERESGGDTLKKTMILKEIPRLSLDSRVKSIQTCSTTASESRSNFLLVGNHHQQHKRSSSVVAKLMGLEEASYTPSIHEESATSADKVTPRQRQSLSVYSEIEKRVAELEFQKSGKDLRALKHILEAIHRSEKQEQATLQKNIKKSDKLNDKVRLARNREDSLANERKSLSPRRRNYIKDPGQRLSSAKNNVQVGSNGAVSPRLQSHLPSPEMSRVRRPQNARQTKDLGLQSRRFNNKLKSRNPQQDFSGEIRSYIRNFGEQCDTASVHSESDNSFASHMYTEVTSKYRTTGRKLCKELDCSVRLVENMLTDELQISTKEQRSPVSVLDETFYIEDSPSPVKKISATYTEYDAADDNEAEWHSKEFGNSPLTPTGQHLGSEINYEKSEDDEMLLQHNLRMTNSMSTADQTEFFCHNSDDDDDADRKYVNKILLASGILRDVSRASTITWLHPTVHLINPELFDVLEQTEELQNEGPTKELSQSKFDQKTHRKIVFDTVKEIIVQKLSPEEGLSMRGGRHLSGHQLLKEVHREMDYLRPTKQDSSLDAEKDELVSIINADLKHESEEWVESHCEIPTLVVDIERLIFKELITEIIGDEAARLQDRSRRHCRQLFRT